jgi:hypothetical protein
MEPTIFTIAVSITFFVILFFIIRGAVEEGTYNALMRYEKDKEQINKNNS